MALLDTQNKRIAVAATLLVIAVALFVMNTVQQTEEPRFIINQGKVYGTTYSIKYEATQDFESEIQTALQEVDNSLSRFNPNSTISKINNGGTETDAYFLKCFNKAAEIYEVSDGAYDITVGPLVNAWGFGTADRPSADPQTIDSILAFIGFNKVHLNGDQLLKDDPRIILDASSIAKGYGCDVAADVLRQHGVTNFMVEIGGEVVCEGLNQNGEQWHIGINTPKDDPAGVNTDLQAIVAGDMALATSGSYRQFYYENGIRRSHTIDPRTGCPVSNSLLSATIIAPDCMTADGLATACMVMGLTRSMNVIENMPNTEGFFIYDVEGTQFVRKTSGFDRYIVDK